MDWNSVMHASLSAHFGISVVECLLALVGRMLGIGAGRAEVVVGDDFQDDWRAEFADSTFTVERVMVGLEVFNSAQGARTTRRRRIARSRVARRRRIVRRMMMRRFGRVWTVMVRGIGLGFIPYGVDSHVQW